MYSVLKKGPSECIEKFGKSLLLNPKDKFTSF